jgi:hypothetical protein
VRLATFGPAGRSTSCVAAFHDLSERRQAEADRAALQAQLYRAQKLEALAWPTTSTTC